MAFWTRVNSDRAENIQRRHEFFAAKMHERLPLKMKDPQRMFGALEREIIYYRDQKRCGECDADVIWSEAEIHHVDQHSQGGKTAFGERRTGPPPLSPDGGGSDRTVCG